MTSSANTNSAIAVITQSRKSWNQMMSSITGVAQLGLQKGAQAVDYTHRHEVAGNDPELALAQLGQPEPWHQHCSMCSFEKNGLVQAPFSAHHCHDVWRNPAEHGICHGRGSLAVRRDGEKSRPLKPQFQLCRNEPNRRRDATNRVSKRASSGHFPASCWRPAARVMSCFTEPFRA
jgi:hypothetical protein